MAVIIVSLHNRTAERRWWQNACVWQTRQGYYWPVLLWSSRNLSGLLQKICLKEGEVWQKIFFKQKYCHACHTRFSFFFPLPSCCVSSLIKGGQRPEARDLPRFLWAWPPVTFIGKKRQTQPKHFPCCSMSNSLPTNCIYAYRGYFRNFWVEMCCWDHGTLNLYQS